MQYVKSQTHREFQVHLSTLVIWIILTFCPMAFWSILCNLKYTQFRNLHLLKLQNVAKLILNICFITIGEAKHFTSK